MRFFFSRSNLAKLSEAEVYAMLHGGGSDAERAFKEIYRRYGPRIHAYCFKILDNREEAEDVFQETFVRFFTGARGQRELTNMSGYLFRIARNLSLNRIRDRGPATESLEGVEPAIGADHSLEQGELLGLIADAVKLLNLEYREAFILREYDNMSYEEIAELTGSTPGNVKSRVFRARQKIRKILEASIRELQ